MSSKWSSQVLGKTVNFGDLLKDEYYVILLQGKNVFGDIIYCYVKVTIPNLKLLQETLQTQGNFNPSDYGEVIAAGKGTPSEEVRAEIALTYPMLQEPKPVHAPTSLKKEEKKSWDEY